jgi:hypothetical protein
LRWREFFVILEISRPGVIKGFSLWMLRLKVLTVRGKWRSNRSLKIVQKVSKLAFTSSFNNTSFQVIWDKLVLKRWWFSKEKSRTGLEVVLLLGGLEKGSCKKLIKWSLRSFTITPVFIEVKSILVEMWSIREWESAWMRVDLRIV